MGAMPVRGRKSRTVSPRIAIDHNFLAGATLSRRARYLQACSVGQTAWALCVPRVSDACPGGRMIYSRRAVLAPPADGWGGHVAVSVMLERDVDAIDPKAVSRGQTGGAAARHRFSAARQSRSCR